MTFNSIGNLDGGTPDLSSVIAANPVNSIDDVIAVLRGIDTVLPSDDGLKWFNVSYLHITEAIKAAPLNTWEDPAWLERLDVLFCGRYFKAVMGWERDPATSSSAWRPLNEKRHAQGIQRLQFALAGINAHINHDLCLALVDTGDDQGVVPKKDTPQYRDYLRVNAILAGAIEEIKAYLSTGIIGEVDQDLGQIDDIIAMWSVTRARDAAWDEGEILWHIRSTGFLRDMFLRNLDSVVGLTSRGLLVSVG